MTPNPGRAGEMPITAYTTLPLRRRRFARRPVHRSLLTTDVYETTLHPSSSKPVSSLSNKSRSAAWTSTDIIFGNFWERNTPPTSHSQRFRESFIRSCSCRYYRRRRRVVRTTNLRMRKFYCHPAQETRRTIPRIEEGSWKIACWAATIELLRGISRYFFHASLVWDDADAAREDLIRWFVQFRWAFNIVGDVEG